MAGSGDEATGDDVLCCASATVALNEIDTLTADDRNSVLIERLMKTKTSRNVTETLLNEYKGFDHCLGGYSREGRVEKPSQVRLSSSRYLRVTVSSPTAGDTGLARLLSRRGNGIVRPRSPVGY